MKGGELSSNGGLTADHHDRFDSPLCLLPHTMPSAVPPEVWSRIFFFLAPPLPFVGMEKESFVEDAKQTRNDSIRGQWNDIENLMLVSKRVNVSPEHVLLSTCLGC